MYQAVVIVLLLLLVFLVLSRSANGRAEGMWGADPTLDASRAFSPYGNISLADVDSLAAQRVFMSADASGTDGIIDNSDAVAAALGYATTFQPNQLGVTPTTSGALGSFQMGEPGRTVPFQIPLSGTLDADELLARKQQHNGGRNKRAIDGAVRSTADLYRKYFQNELAEAEGNDWWSAEAAPIETDFDPAS
jgi:hypothetical protein